MGATSDLPLRDSLGGDSGPSAQYRGATAIAGPVLGTAFDQLRFAASVAFGLPFSVVSLDRLVGATLATRHEFNTLGADGTEILGGPALNAADRREMQVRRFRAQAQRAARETSYYSRLFQRLALDPTRLRAEDIDALPLTRKEALRSEPDAFVRTSAKPAFRTTTTGTTGRPTGVSFSLHELQVYIALNAIGFLVDGQIGPEDVVQISASARATLGNTCVAGACARIGAQVYLAGLVAPELGLRLLSEDRALAGKKPRASVLDTYPSYLGRLVEAGRKLGYGPADFGLEQIIVGGEIVTAGLKARAARHFGPVSFHEGYGMTEIWPQGAIRCEAGHLHFEPSRGLVEVLDPETGRPAAPGAVGTIVATPFPPYRETTLVLRYDTEDLVHAVAGPLTCRLHHLPATSDLLGKRRLAVRDENGWTTPRQVLEALEAVAAVPLPARCGFWAVPGGVAVEVLVRDQSSEVRRAVADSLEGQGVPLRELRLFEDRGELTCPLPLRDDLEELGFPARGSEVVTPPSMLAAHRELA